MKTQGAGLFEGLDDAESAARVRVKLANAISSVLRLGINHSDAARIQWQTVAQKYRERWAQGDLEGLVPVMSDLFAWLRRAGIDPALNAEVTALLRDPVLANIRGRLAPIDAHTKLLEMFRELAGTLDN